MLTSRATATMGLFTRLTVPDVATIAAAYGLHGLEVEGIPYGTINSNFRARAGERTCFLRVNEGKSEAEVDHEAALVRHLAARGVRTPVPIATVDGAPWVRLACGIVSVFPWIEGAPRDDERLAPDDVRALGVLLGELHEAGRGFPLRSAGRYGWDVIQRRLEALPVDCCDAALESARVVLTDEVAALASLSGRRAALPTGVIHGDLFPDNVLWDDVGPIPIDFEQASDGTWLYDLAVCLLAWAWDGRALDSARARALVSGYQSVRALGEDEATLFWDEARAAAVRFTVTRIGDVYLNPETTPEVRRVKDFRAFLARLAALRAIGPETFRTVCFG